MSENKETSSNKNETIFENLKSFFESIGKSLNELKEYIAAIFGAKKITKKDLDTLKAALPDTKPDEKTIQQLQIQINKNAAQNSGQPTPQSLAQPQVAEKKANIVLPTQVVESGQSTAPVQKTEKVENIEKPKFIDLNMTQAYKILNYSPQKLEQKYGKNPIFRLKENGKNIVKTTTQSHQKTGILLHGTALNDKEGLTKIVQDAFVNCYVSKNGAFFELLPPNLGVGATNSAIRKDENGYNVRKENGKFVRGAMVNGKLHSNESLISVEFSAPTFKVNTTDTFGNQAKIDEVSKPTQAQINSWNRYKNYLKTTNPQAVENLGLSSNGYLTGSSVHSDTITWRNDKNLINQLGIDSKKSLAGITFRNGKSVLPVYG